MKFLLPNLAYNCCIRPGVAATSQPPTPSVLMSHTCSFLAHYDPMQPFKKVFRKKFDTGVGFLQFLLRNLAYNSVAFGRA